MALLFALLYARILRPRVINHGAGDAEISATLPGDAAIAPADGVATRAITIHAAPEHVWPWLAQIGPLPRGGVYTYDWIENLLGMDIHSSDVVLEQFQHPEVGLTIDFGPNVMELIELEPGRHLVWRSVDGNWVWAFVLVETADGQTRLVSRNSYRLPRLVDRLGMLPMEPASLVMERKMLRGIKQRAERLAAA